MDAYSGNGLEVDLECLILDWRTGGTTDYGLAVFRIALAVHYVVGAPGLVGILRTRRVARQKMAEEGVVVRPVREILAERRGLAIRRSVKAEAPGKESGQMTMTESEVGQRRT